MSKVASITRAGGLIVNPQHATASTTQYARGYISEGPAVTDGLVLYLDAADYASYPGEYSLLDVSGGIGWVDYSSSQQHYRTMGEKGVILLGTSTGWIGRFEVTPTATGNHTLMFDYWADAQVTMVFNNDGIMDNAYTATLTAETYKKTHSVTVNHTTTGAMYHYFRNNASGTKVYIDNVRFFKDGTTWNDLSGNGNDGTIAIGMFSLTLDSTAGPCFNLDGTNDYIYMPQFDFTSTHSLEWWFNTDNLTEKYTGGYAGHMLCWGHSPSERIYLKTNGGITIYIHDSSSSGTFDTSNFSVTAGEWIHITATLDWVSKSVKFYQNGVLKDTIDISSLGSWNYTGASNPYDYIDFGRNVSNNNIFFDGKVANIKIYTELLTAAQVKQNFNSERNRFGV